MDILNVVTNIFLEQSELWWLAFLFIFGWVWTLKVDNVDTYMAAYINDLQDCKVDTDEVPLLDNILLNSKFGLWSQSDVNKGLGSLTYDNKIGTFQVGEAINNVAYISANLQFNDLNPDTITDALNGFLECQFMAGDTITVAGTVNNDGNYTIATVVAGTITLIGGDALANEGPLACTITSTTVIATGKLITDIASVLTLGTCTGRFRDDDGTYAGWIVGATSGATATVNMPDAAVGVDKIKNGEFSVDDDPPPSWVAAQATLTTEGAGQIGNCMMVTATAAANGVAYQQLTYEIGKIYKIGCHFKKGTGIAGKISVGSVADPDKYYTSGDIVDVAWTQYIGTFEAGEANIVVRLYVRDNVIGRTAYFDEITLYEITPCCTGADMVAFDGGWVKVNHLDIYRQHWDATYAKNGSFYSLKMVPTQGILDGYVDFPGDLYDNEEWYAQFQGRVVMFGAWVYTDKPNHARLRILDSVGNTQSAYHTGAAGWEWLEVTRLVDDATTSFRIRITADAVAHINGTSIVYISQLMLTFGQGINNIIGEGNYQPKQQEWIYGEAFIPSNKYDNTTGWGDVAWTDLNLEADSDAMLPKGAKAIRIHAKALDSGSGALVDVHIHLRKNGTIGEDFSMCWGGRTSSVECHASGIQPCNPDGDVEIELEASDGATLDIVEFRYLGVQVT